MSETSNTITRYRSLFPLFYLAALSALCIHAVQSYMSLPFQPLLILEFVGLVLGIYLLNRVSDLKEDFTNDASRLVFYEKEKLYLAGAIGILAVTLLTLVMTNRFHWIFPVLIGIGLCYSYPLVPTLRQGKFDFARIKDITLVKNLAVAILWGGCVVGVPLAYSQVDFRQGGTVWLLSLALTISTFTNTLFDDILDEAGDRLANVPTLPVVLGAKACYLILLGTGMTWVTLVMIGFSQYGLNRETTAFLLILAFYPLTYMSVHRIMPKHKAWVDFLAETDLLVFACGLYLLSPYS